MENLKLRKWINKKEKKNGKRKSSLTTKSKQTYDFLCLLAVSEFACLCVHDTTVRSTHMLQILYNAWPVRHVLFGRGPALSMGLTQNYNSKNQLTDCDVFRFVYDMQILDFIKS